MADLSELDVSACPPALNIGALGFERVTAEMSKAVPGITAEQIQTFIAVVRGPNPQIELSKLTGFARQATSRHVAKLVKAGLVAQRRDLLDGRRKVVRLTAPGRLISAVLSAPSEGRGK